MGYIGGKAGLAGYHTLSHQLTRWTFISVATRFLPTIYQTRLETLGRNFASTSKRQSPVPNNPQTSTSPALTIDGSSAHSVPRREYPMDNWDSNNMDVLSSENKKFDADTTMPSPANRAPPRLGSTAGKSLAVRAGDLAGAILQLRRLCNENSIPRDAATQRFYERPGMKKKRLRRERFRRRFKESFKKMVNTVLEMKKQGI